MGGAGWIVTIGVALTVVIGPMLVSGTGWARARGEAAIARPRWDWRLSAASALLYALTFNLAFFIQELFLVLPKAFTPGLRPTLFHNNHTWAGDSPLAALFQGTGALAVLIVGITCLLSLKGGKVRSPTLRLLLIWLAYHGFFQTLPQVVVGSINPHNDVGMAMNYFGLGAAPKAAMALAALASMPLVAGVLSRHLLELADDPAAVATGYSRQRFVFLAAFAPALLAIVLIVPFRVPREMIEVVILPLVVTIVGLVWMQASAWHVRIERVGAATREWPLAGLAAALVGLLLVFQLLLRPGIRFF